MQQPADIPARVQQLFLCSEHTHTHSQTFNHCTSNADDEQAAFGARREAKELHEWDGLDDAARRLIVRLTTAIEQRSTQPFTGRLTMRQT